MIRTRIACRLFAAGAAALAVGIAFLVPSPRAVAQADQQLVPGLGIFSPDRTDFVGFYRALVDGHWTKVYCIRPNSGEPTQISLRTLSHLPHRSRAVTRLLARTLSDHGDAGTVVEAAAVSQALNEELGNHAAVARRAQWLPDPVQPLTDQYVQEARAEAGPFRLAIDLPRSPLPGRSARGTVRLSSGTEPARGTVRLIHTGNVTVPDELSIGRSGRARFRYETVAGGPVHIRAAARVAPDGLRASSPGAGEQLMISWARPARIHAGAGYEATGPGIAYRYACSSECNGHPLVTLRACAPASTYGSIITFRFGDDGSRHIRFAADEHRRCSSIATTLADGTPVTASWRYRMPSGWTRRFPATGAFVVDCPAAPPIAVAVGFNCDRARVSAALGSEQDGTLRRLYNRTSHRMVLVVSGAVSGRYVVRPGTRAAVHTFGVACGTGASVTVRGGVQRTDGSYNYGEPVQVTMP